MHYAQRTFLAQWLWTWPALGLLTLASWASDRTAFAECPQVMFAAPLLGTTAGGWAWLRPFDRRLFPSCYGSAILLVHGFIAYWVSP